MKNKLNERIKNFNITILISLFLLLSCGSGQQPQAGKDGEAATGGSSLSEVLMEVGRSAENAFYSFLELLSDTLGFTAKSTTKKEDVGGYFSSLGMKLGKASEELEQVAVKATAGVDKGDASKNPIRAAVDEAKTILNTLKTHLDSLGKIGNEDVVGEVPSANKQGASVSINELKAAYKALKGIVDTADKVGVGDLKEGNVQMNAGIIGVAATPEDGAKVLTTGAAGAAVGDKAALIVSAVSGEEILAAIVKSQEGDADKTIGNNADGNTSALEFAKGGNTAAHLAQGAVKPSAVSAGIALRSLVKDGKLASHNANNDEKAVQAVGVTAANKLLRAVEDIIKKTVKNVLDKVKKEVDEVRKPKTAVQ
ncbi:variable large family protein [Borrelia turicatae]|uniref:Variable large protein n=1 Tax=Borrelia turicatae (strain 91E135) TaxID=314724 RepID=A0ABF7R0B8_BORT9|nr:variable large family protein [Borrelia turicatae]ASJ27702.1 VlpA9 [Borrelia turicatae 91E135]UPA14147.1 variable large family protein [Borrelia turicatae 91E135]